MTTHTATPTKRRRARHSGETTARGTELHEWALDYKRLAAIEEPTEESIDEQDRVFLKIYQGTEGLVKKQVRLSRLQQITQHTLEDVMGEYYDKLKYTLNLFRPELGNQFSTYLQWAIYRHLQRMIDIETRYKSRIDVIGEYTRNGIADRHTLQPDEQAIANERTERTTAILYRRMDRLTERERDVIRRRFGLEGFEPTTLDAIGQEFGVCRERVRQLADKAIFKLRILCKELND